MPDPIGSAGQDGINALGGAGAVELLRQMVAQQDMLIRQNEVMRRSQAANNKEIEVYGSDLHSIMKDAANLELSIKRIGQLQKTAMYSGSTKSQAVETIKAVTKEYENLLKTVNKTHGGDAYTKKLTKNLEDMRRALVAVEAQSEDTWNTDGIKAANRELTSMHLNVKNLANAMGQVKVSRMNEEFRTLGRTVDDAFHNRLSMGLRKIPGIGHIMQATDLNRRFREAGHGVEEYKAKRKVQQDDMAQRITQQRADLVRAKFGGSGIRTLNAMGHPSGDPGGRNIRQMLGINQIHAATKGSAPGNLETATMNVVVNGKLNLLNPHTKPGLGPIPQVGGAADQARLGREDRLKLLRQVRTDRLEAAAATPEAIAAHLASHGDRLNRAMDAAKDAQGGGAVDTAASIAGKLLKGGPIISGLIGVVQAAISMHDKVAESNLKVSEALAGSGMFGGGGSAYENLHGVRHSLISTSFGQQMMYGQGFEKNLELYKTLGEGGIATGRSLNKGIDLGGALEYGQGFHGALMQNSVVNGHMVGMAQQDSARLTLKLIEKFGQTTEATKQFFVELNEFSNTSGISASRIVDMVDSVTEQFTDLQKSLVGTVEALHKVGQAGLFMGKRVEDTIKGLTKPLEMSPAQRYFNISQQMANGGGMANATLMRSQNAEERGRLLGPSGVLNKYGLNASSTNEEIVAAIHSQGDGIDDETRRADMEAYQQHAAKYAMNESTANAWASRDVKGVAAAQMNGGASITETLSGRVQQMRNLSKTAGIDMATMNAAMSGNPEAMSRIAHNFTFAMASQHGVFGAGEDPMKILREAGNARQAGAATIMDVAKGAPEAAGELKDAGATYQEKQANQAKYRLLTRYGKTVASAGVFKHTGGEDNYAQEFSQYMKLNKDDIKAMGRVEKALTHDSGMTEEVLRTNGDLSDAMKSQTALEQEKAAQEKRDAEAINTTTSDMAMARAFEYLFTKVTDHIDQMADLMPDSTGARKMREGFVAASQARTDSVRAAIGDPGKLTGTMAKAWMEYSQGTAHAGEGNKGDMQALDARQESLANYMKDPSEWIWAPKGQTIISNKKRDDRLKAEKMAADAADLRRINQLGGSSNEVPGGNGTWTAPDYSHPADPATLDPNASVAATTAAAMAAHAKQAGTSPSHGNVTHIHNNVGVSQHPFIPTAASPLTPEATRTQQVYHSRNSDHTAYTGGGF